MAVTGLCLPASHLLPPAPGTHPHDRPCLLRPKSRESSVTLRPRLPLGVEGIPGVSLGSAGALSSASAPPNLGQAEDGGSGL